MMMMMIVVIIIIIIIIIYFKNVKESGVKSTSHFHLFPRLRMSGELPPVPPSVYAFMLWTGKPYYKIFSSPPTLQTVTDLGFQHDPSPFPLFSGHSLPISHSHCREVIFNLASPSLPWTPSFPYSFHLIVTVYFDTLFTFTACKGECNMVIRNKCCAQHTSRKHKLLKMDSAACS